jgi:hypothetical protein
MSAFKELLHEKEVGNAHLWDLAGDELAVGLCAGVQFV